MFPYVFYLNLKIYPFVLFVILLQLPEINLISIPVLMDASFLRSKNTN